MHRRQCLKTLSAATLALPRRTRATDNGGNGRFVPAICAYSFRNQFQDGSFHYADLIRMTADVGAGGVDLTTYWLPDTKDETLFALKRLAYRLGVSIYTIGIRARMVQPTPELREAEAGTIRQWLGVAEKLGAAHMRIFGGSVPRGTSEDQAVAWAVQTLKRSADESAKKGITLGVEDDSGITLSADRTVEIILKTASPCAGINLDIGNFPDNAYSQIEKCAPYATNVHFKEQVHMNHQSEPADWPRILKILGNAGYRGYLALEYESTEAPLANVPKLIAKMRETIGRA